MGCAPVLRPSTGRQRNQHREPSGLKQRIGAPAAERCFRRAVKIGKRSGGIHSYTARLASSALGELLYERGALDEADRLLEEGYKLGPEDGSVDVHDAFAHEGACSHWSGPD
jgi:hypothetical protein